MFKDRAHYWVNPKTGRPRYLFNELYNDYPDPWGCEMAKSALSKKILLEMIPEDIKTNSRILDVGCGEGGLTHEIQKKLGKKAKVVGLEISSVAVARAKRRYGGICFMAGNLCSLGTRRLYDRVVLSEVVWYLAATLDSSVVRIRNLIKASGKLCVHQFFPRQQRFFRNIRGPEGVLKILKKHGFSPAHLIRVQRSRQGEVLLASFCKK